MADTQQDVLVEAVPRGRLYTVQLDAESGAVQLEQVLTTVKQNRVGDVTSNNDCLVLGGHVEGPTSSLTLSELFVHVWRRHGFHANERQSVVSAEDQLVVVQLCLATLNKEKCGDFDVDASTVMEMHKTLREDKMAAVCSDDDQHNTPVKSAEYEELRAAYDQFLKYCNMADLYDIVGAVKKELQHNEDLKKDLSTRDYVLINKPQAPIELEMLKVVAGRTAATLRVSVGTPLGEEASDAGFVETAEVSLEEALSVCEEVAPPTATSVTQSYAESVLVSYLQILVNSRSELGLARALNVPDRELDHKAFTALKKEAKQKGLSMFQTASSFIMKLRLGGRGYAPCADHPLGVHVKGLSEFVDLLHKLQTIMEEDNNCSNAVKRVINVVKNTIVKHRDNVLRRTSVEAAAERLQQTAARVVMSLGSDNPLSPQRPAGMGGSMLGRDTLRVLRHLVDSHAGVPMVTRTVDILSDVTSSQKTPLRFPSLLSKFRSPVEASPDDKINKSLAERLLEKMETKPKVCGVPRYQACYDWAQPVHDVSNMHLTAGSDCFTNSGTLVHAAPAKPKGAGSRRVLESRGDQENMDRDVELDAHPAPVQPSRSQPASKRPAENNAESAPTQKRLKQAPSRKPASKAVGKPAGKANKKKTGELQKGQRQMTAFFRV